LWGDPGVKIAYERSRSELRYWYNQLDEDAHYFLDSVERFAGEKFEVRDEDILKTSNAPTVAFVGLSEMEFNFRMTDQEELHIRMVDVCSRGDRRKWLRSYFEGVNYVVFYAPMEDFDNFLEDFYTNRLRESITFFGEVVSNIGPSSNTSFVVLLTNRDIFEKKLSSKGLHSSLKKFFPSFEGSSVEEAVTFVKKQFENECKQKGRVYVHASAVSDPHNISFIFDSIKNSRHHPC